MFLLVWKASLIIPCFLNIAKKKQVNKPRIVGIILNQIFKITDYFKTIT